jgi:putative cell wall-binding protein
MRLSSHGSTPMLRVAVGVIAALILSLLAVSPAQAATLRTSPTAVDAQASSDVVRAAAVVGFDATNIISDALFYDGNAMTAQQIQSFLDGKIGGCQNGRCLNVLSITSPSRPAYYSQTTGNLVCGDLAGGTMSAAEYIYRVQVACGISAKVILVTMQKEQSLVTATAPSDTQLRRAMGHLCSDSAPCETHAAGVSNQIFGGAEQLKKYKATAFGKQPGRNWIGYHPNTACGGTYLDIKNYATAALYNYTPYQPNVAALAAGSGIGDLCSSYGNRNFHNFYTAWFGSTQAAVDPCKPPTAISPASGEYTTTDSLNARSAPTTSCANIVTTLPAGAIVTRTGVFGAWWQVRVDWAVYWVHSDYLKPTPAVSYKVDRIEGADRYETAAAISRQTHAAGSATVFLASGQLFPDSVSGAPLAAHRDAALLLTANDHLPAATAARLAELKPSSVRVLGGPDAVSDAVLAQVRAVVPASAVDRIEGVDRYDTARKVVAEGWTTAPVAYVAAGEAFPDALSASSAAAAQDRPVLLVAGAAENVPQASMDLLRSRGVTSVVIAGGPQAVSSGIEAQLRAAGIAVTRKAGLDRYETSLALAQYAYPGPASRVFLASGAGFPDALSGSVLSGSLGAPLLLQTPWCMSGGAKDYAISRGAAQVTLLGGKDALGAAVFDGARC